MRGTPQIDEVEHLMDINNQKNIDMTPIIIIMTMSIKLKVITIHLTITTQNKKKAILKKTETNKTNTINCINKKIKLTKENTIQIHILLTRREYKEKYKVIK